MITHAATDSFVKFFRQLGYLNYLLTPVILVAVGMSGDAGGLYLPLLAITLAVLFFSMPLLCSSISKKQLAAGNSRAALIIAAIPLAFLLMFLAFVLVNYFLLLKLGA